MSDAKKLSPSWPALLGTFTRAHLSDSDRLGETLCGLVTVLGFTLVASANVDEGEKGVLQMLVATVGCCVTWGLIDGLLYVLDAVAQRARRGRVAQSAREAAEEEALRIVRTEIGELLTELGVDDADAITRALHARIARAPVPGLRIERDDWLGGIAIFLTQILCCAPAILPFALLDDPALALRLSNAMLLLLLLGVGAEWAADVGARRGSGALAAGLLGSGLVAISIALSG